MIWRLNDGRNIEFGAVKDEKDKEKYQGRAHSGKFFDEITHFTRSQFEFLTAWTRSTISGERCRVVCTGNPPTTAEGDWVIDYWAAWLDEKHPNPAQPGELRWYTNIDGKEIERPNGEPFFHEEDGVETLITPKSRTFIPASINDNPYLRDSGYKSTLQALPDELRQKLLHGKFTSSREDNPWQVIPSDWVMQAQARWHTRQKPQVPLSAIGADIARGGSDRTVLFKRYLNWFDYPDVHPGSTTPDGVIVASLIMAQLEQGTKVNVDVIGVGTSVFDILKTHGIDVYAMNASNKSEAMDKFGNLSFFNQRAEWYWRMREALDPESGDEICLPPGRELLADLTAPRWELTTRGIKVEPKENIIARIGRSPDLGDAAVYTLAIKTVSFAYGSL